MEQVFDIAQAIKTTPDLFPYVLLAVTLTVVYKCRDAIKRWFDASVDSKKEAVAFHAQHAELVRNNTAALENNTAALEMVSRDRDVMVDIIKHHEELSAERMGKIQEAVEQTRDGVTKNAKDIAVISERVR